MANDTTEQLNCISIQAEETENPRQQSRYNANHLTNMKKTILFTFIALGAIMTSCKSPMQYSTRTARTETMPVETWSSWTTADLEVAEQKVRITIQAPADNSFAVSEKQLKENAIGELLEKYNADILVNPLFKCDYQDGKLVSVTVSGYPAKHKNFRTITFEEQSQFMIEKEKATNSPQIVINGGEIKNEVAAPCPGPAPAQADPKNKAKK